MKFKVYGFSNLYKHEKLDYSDIGFVLLPSITFNVSSHNFEPDEQFDYWRKGRNYFIIFSWLFWGFTLDFRTGIDSGGIEE